MIENRTKNHDKINILFLSIYFVFLFCIPPNLLAFSGAWTAVLILISYLCLEIFSISYKYINAYIVSLAGIFLINPISAIFNDGSMVIDCIYALHYIVLILTLHNYYKKYKNIESLIKIIFWPAFIGGPVIGLYQMYSGHYLYSNSAEIDLFMRTIMSDVRHGNPNYTALTMMFCAFLAYYLYRKYSNRVYFFCALVSLLCMLLTYSRTTIFVFILFLGLFILSKTIKRINKPQIHFKIKISIKSISIYLIAVFALCLIVYISSVFISNYVQNAEFERLLRYKESSTLGQRIEQWRASIEIILTNGLWHFLFGFSNQASVIMGNITGREMSSHNFIFARTSENGVLGFIGAIILYVGFFFRLYKIYSKFQYSNEIIILLCTACMLICYLMVSVISWDLIISLIISNIIFCNYREFIKGEKHV